MYTPILLLRFKYNCASYAGREFAQIHLCEVRKIFGKIACASCTISETECFKRRRSLHLRWLQNDNDKTFMYFYVYQWSIVFTSGL